jgi:hypothetical protein
VSAQDNMNSDQFMYHLTDKPKFKPNPEFAPEDNAVAIEDRSGQKGIYLAKDPAAWVAGHGYVRPYVAEFKVDPAVEKSPGVHGRYGGEMFVPGGQFDKIKLNRVIPLDAHAREEYGGPGWIEEHHGTEFDTGKPIENPGWNAPVSAHYPYRGYHYPGPDVRDMPKEQTDEHRKRWRAYLKDRRP